MKKRLNIYCLLIAALILVQIVITANELVIGFSSGWNTAKMEDEIQAKSSYTSVLTLNMIPDQLTPLTEAKFSEKVSGGDKRAKVWPVSVMVAKPESKMSFAHSLSILVAVIACIYFAIKLIVHFMKFILNVNKQRVFLHDNVKHLRWVGGLLLAFGVMETVYGMLDTYKASLFFQLDHYHILYSSAIKTGTIVCGLVTLIMAETFAIGLKMKEDADLTI